MFTKYLPTIVYSGCFHTRLEMATTQMSIHWGMDKQIMINQEMDTNNIKEQSILIHTTYLRVKSCWRKKLNTKDFALAWFYLRAIIGQAKQSILKESRSVVAWEFVLTTEGTREVVGVIEMARILFVVVDAEVYSLVNTHQCVHLKWMHFYTWSWHW